MTVTTWNNLLRYLQFTGFAIIAVAIPFSNFFMSFGMFWLAGVVMLQVSTDVVRRQSLAPRWNQFTSNSTAVALTILFLLPLLGLLWTTHYEYALWDVRMKLPLLVLPLLISLSHPITQGQFRALVGLYILAVVMAVLWCLQVYWMGSPEIDRDVRKISVFISHVRFSLLIALALGLVVRFAYDSAKGRVFIVLYALPCIYFIYIIGSITGAVVLAVLCFWMILRVVIQQRMASMRFAMLALLIAAMTVVSVYVKKSYTHYFSVEPINWNTIEKTTPRGELYDHHPDFLFVEEGHYVMTYVAWGEMYDAWYNISTVHLDSLDGRGHPLKGTLIRYLASKELRKDADGVAALDASEVRAIELGVPTCTDTREHGLRKRLNRIFFEWSNYRAGGDPDGHSIIQRWEFWKTAAYIIRNNFWIGVGTGDVKEAFRDAYTENESPLNNAYRLRAHNQYLTMWLTYGIGGLILFLLVVFFPVMKRNRRDSLTVMIVLLVSLSFITEDTLESQAGVMFMAFFYTLFTAKRALSLEELRSPKSKVKRLSGDAPLRK
jgi:hypothetical protein